MLLNGPHNYKDCRESSCGNTLFRSGDVTSSWVITLSGGRLYCNSFFYLIALRVAFHAVHSSKTKILCIMRIPHIWGVCCFLFDLAFPFVFFLTFLSCLCSCYNLLYSTTPWQHIRGGFPLSGVWSVSNSLTLAHTAAFVNFAAVSHLILFSLKTCVFV